MVVISVNPGEGFGEFPKGEELRLEERFLTHIHQHYNIYMLTHTCLHGCTHTHMHTYRHLPQILHTHVCTKTHSNTNKHYIHMLTYAYTCMHTYANT